jgi:hypothetical protein
MSKFDALRSKKTKALPARDEAKPIRPSATDPAPVQQVLTTRRIGKRSTEGYTQVSAYIRTQTHKDVKRALLDEDSERDFSELVDELLADWLNTRGRK